MIEGKSVQGVATLSTQTDATILAAAGTGSRYYIRGLCISISVFAATAVLTIHDGTTTLVTMLLKDANGSLFNIVFPGDGYKLADNGALTMTVATANATVRVAAVGIQRTDPA